MTVSRRPIPPACRRAAAAVAAVILLVLLNLIILGVVQRSASDQDIAISQARGIQAFYAAEAAQNMALAEIMKDTDADGDGTVGSISDDGNDANNPLIGTARAKVVRTELDEGTSLVASAVATDCRRSTQCLAMLSGMAPHFEVDSTTASATPTTVTFERTYTNPVVVCTPRYVNNTQPFVVRVRNVTATSFQLYLQSPGDLTTPVPETVWYIVMEAGAYNVNGVKYEAQKYISTVTDRKQHWNGQSQNYLNSYDNPVVIGQVMTTNDAKWSAFWCMGQNSNQPPHKFFLNTGKHVGEDTVTGRANETIGFIVFEQGHARLGGMTYDAIAGGSVRGIDNSPPYNVNFQTAFPTAPTIIFASKAGANNNDGGYMVVYGNPIATASRAYLAIDEDKISDAERSATADSACVVAFRPPGPGAAILAWNPVAPQ